MISSEHGWEELGESEIPESLELPNSPSRSTRPAHDHKLYRVWSLPLYAVTYIVHSRYRALRPRRLPTLTSLRLPEIYGMLAIGDICGYQGLHLYKQLQLEENYDRGQVANYAGWFYKMFHKNLREPRFPGSSDLTRKGLPRGEDGKVTLLGEILWRLRTIRTTANCRLFASSILEDHIAACDLNDHDASVLVTIVAERLGTGFNQSATFFPEGELRWIAVLTTALRAATIWTGPGRLVALAVNGMQRAALYAFMYPSLTWEYYHFRSIWNIQEPDKAVEAARRQRKVLVDAIRRFTEEKRKDTSSE
ncbi:hypothetical protein K466DRAFT_590489 [Polyporus arcularius HHB13444]|uniref:Uncharacterized protein n=1 Tax=Polyporus arcularius HHB13444 TaxID=1314778 RepID=A0A5C3NYH1_9APHY|nr:hypothetical protein K466DRAFT_590489 [Polyporus arcularius HHB13444]